MCEILRGDLEVLNLASVLQLIEAEAVTGLMTFDQGAEIRFKHGQLVSASIGQPKVRFPASRPAPAQSW